MAEIRAADIHTAINAVMGAVGYVRKERSDALKYSFAGERALIEAIRPALVEHGITMRVSRILDRSFDVYANVKSTYETRMSHAVVVAEITFTHAPSGTFVTVQATGEGSDSSDKAYNKALTGAYKYALRQTFCIETGDDPDKEDPNANTGRVRSRKPTLPAKPAPQRVDTESGEIRPPAPSQAPTQPPGIDAKALAMLDGLRRFLKEFGWGFSDPHVLAAFGSPEKLTQSIILADPRTLGELQEAIAESHRLMALAALNAKVEATT